MEDYQPKYQKEGSVVKGVYIVFVVLLAIFVALVWLNIANAQEPTCPEGSYDIGITKNGEPLCKIEPTGCPYGDSIPLEKCDPEALGQTQHPSCETNGKCFPEEEKPKAPKANTQWTGEIVGK